jgi:hypothetical protein
MHIFGHKWVCLDLILNFLLACHVGRASCVETHGALQFWPLAIARKLGLPCLGQDKLLQQNLSEDRSQFATP